MDPLPHREGCHQATQHLPLQANDDFATFLFSLFFFFLLVPLTLEISVSHMPLSQQSVSLKWP